VRRPDEPAYRPFAIAVLQIAHDHILEMTAFHDPALFPAFALPPSLPPRPVATAYR
jgi:RNA polymerase sigma-70 factor (ECF subfamily)